MALVWPGAGGRDVTRAKKLMSVFMRGQGSVPFRPMPRRVVVGSFGVDATRMGVVATMRVKGEDDGGGILVVGLGFSSFLEVCLFELNEVGVGVGGLNLDVYARWGKNCLSAYQAPHVEDL